MRRQNPSRATLKAVAAQAAVSISTASRALAGSHLVNAETRARVETAAKELGFWRDAAISRLMAQRRRGQETSQLETIAILSFKGVLGALTPTERHYLESHVMSQGFALDWLPPFDETFTQERAQKVLLARGIRGVIFETAPEPETILRMDLEHFAVATLGTDYAAPLFHRCSADRYDQMWLARKKLAELGYKRPALAMQDFAQHREHDRWRGAFLAGEIDLAHVIPPFVFSWKYGSRNPRDFRKWINAYQPDSVLGLDPDFINFAGEAGLRIPEDFAFVCLHHNLAPRTEVAGVAHPRLHVMQGAVDLVTAQILRGESGIPPVPKTMRIPSQWLDGKTAPPLG